MAVISGMMTSEASEVMTAPKAAPMTTATASSTTFPRRMKSLKPLIMVGFPSARARQRPRICTTTRETTARARGHRGRCRTGTVRVVPSFGALVPLCLHAEVAGFPRVGLVRADPGLHRPGPVAAGPVERPRPLAGRRARRAGRRTGAAGLGQPGRAHGDPGPTVEDG